MSNPPLLEPEPVNPIHTYDEQVRAKYPSMVGSTAWKDNPDAKWQYYFDGIPDNQQAEVLTYARTLGDIP